MSPVLQTTGFIGYMKIIGYGFSIALFEYLNIKDTQLYILSILMLFDFVLGIGKQFIINKKDITSHKAWLGAFKKVTTLMLILSFALMFKGIEIDGTTYINSVLAIFIMAEIYSIIQNIYTIRTGEQHTEYDVVSKIIKAIGNIIEKLIDRKLEDFSKKDK